MRRLVVILAVLAGGTGLALAQPDAAPQISVPQDVIGMAVGSAQRLQFPVPFDHVDVTSDAIVRPVVINDHLMTLQALSEGEAILTVLFLGKELYSAVVRVGIEAGHVVRIYSPNVKDYSGFYCTEHSCGRVDSDLAARDQPASVSVTQNTPTKEGGFNQTTKTYNAR